MTGTGMLESPLESGRTETGKLSVDSGTSGLSNRQVKGFK